MSSSVSDIFWQLIAMAIPAALAYFLSLLLPDMRNDLRVLISILGAILGLLFWNYVIQRRSRRFADWLMGIPEGFSNRTTAILESVKTGMKRFRAYLRGELENCRSELKMEREKSARERAKADKLTLALATLSHNVLSLFDREVEKPDELEWGAALAASEGAVRCARAALSHHVTKIVYHDPSYPASWVRGEDAEQARDYFVKRWFVEKNAHELRLWIRQALKSGLAHRSLIVFAQDIVPDTVAEVRNDTCLLKKYLDAGGRVVWRGDIPFWYQGQVDHARDYWHGPDSSSTGPWKILGVYYHNYRFRWNPPKAGEGLLWGSDLPAEITPIGREIGLRYPSKGIDTRPVACQDVDVTYVLIPQRHFTILDADTHGAGGDFALCWKKNFNERYPHGGFMQYLPGEFLWREVDADFFRFAVSGWPLFFEE